MRPRLVALATLLVALPLRALAWQAVVGDTPAPGRVNAIAMTSAGDVVAVGPIGVAGGGEDSIAVKLDATTGSELWRFVVAGPGGGTNPPRREVQITPSGDAVVFGVTSDTGSVSGAFVARLAGTTGTKAWSVTLHGGGGGNDVARAGALLGEDAVVAGSSSRTDGKGPFTVWRLAAANGAVVWNAAVDAPGGNARVVTTTADSVYVAGHATGAAPGTADVIVARIDALTGDVAWHVVLAGSGHTGDEVAGITVSGNRVIVAAELRGTVTAPDVVVVGLDVANGAEVWRKTFDGTFADSNDGDATGDVAADPSGAVIAVGTLANVGSGADFFAVKLDAATGTQHWRREIDGPTNRVDDARAVAIDGAGDALVVGRMRGATQDFAIVKLDGATGTERWRVLVDGAAGQGDQAFAVAVDPARHVAAGGFTRNPSGDELTVVKVAGATGGSYPCGNGQQDAGEACDDANLVLGDDCRPNCTAEVCGDGIHDPKEACDPAEPGASVCCTVACKAEDDGTPCDDANSCTSADACAAGTCTGDEIACAQPAAACQQATCNPLTGQCLNGAKPGGSVCDDGNACTTVDACVGTTCVGGVEPVCDDAEPCTTDACDPARGCTFAERSGVASASCVLERPAIAATCTAGLPRPLDTRIGRAEKLLGNAAATTRTGRRNRLLKQARSAAKQAERVADKRMRNGSLGSQCGAAVTSAMQDLRRRIDVLLAGG